MKQGQYVHTRSLLSRRKHPGAFADAVCYPAYAPSPYAPPAGVGGLNQVARLLGAVLGLAWFVVTLPIRLVFGLIKLIGRLSGILIGFSMMVVGMALWAGPLFLIGIPMFIIGLLLTCCLG
ncbi:MAG: hypothetical protein U0790_10775 [Isosphaeraceae bacterium]